MKKLPLIILSVLFFLAGATCFILCALRMLDPLFLIPSGIALLLSLIGFILLLKKLYQ